MVGTEVAEIGRFSGNSDRKTEYYIGHLYIPTWSFLLCIFSSTCILEIAVQTGEKIQQNWLVYYYFCLSHTALQVGQLNTMLFCLSQQKFPKTSKTKSWKMTKKKVSVLELARPSVWNRELNFRLLDYGWISLYEGVVKEVQLRQWNMCTESSILCANL